ncbi:MAG: hypothetical protein PHF46_02300 [Candidatus Gracilibacteria bacterium]|nr:hypothetical protein [Candidatus Gracilibacteria bacterium]MDD3120213.1 hypothetical protein [Candidatus Gracilibacteria bacterium]MDD4529965.1 hypothetical protein [Candidatus Gracilibacteria bacterium]
MINKIFEKTGLLKIKDEGRFFNVPEDILDFIGTIDFSGIKESDFRLSMVSQTIDQYKGSINNLTSNFNDKIMLERLLRGLKEFVDGFFAQIFGKTDNFICVCDGKQRIISNVAFQEFTGRDSNQTEEIYKGKEKEKVEICVNSLLAGVIPGYKGIFTMANGKNAGWTTVRIPGSEINLRFGFEAEDFGDYKDFFKLGSIDKISFNEQDFYFLKRIIELSGDIKGVVRLLRGEDLNKFFKIFNLVKIKALILDYMIKFNPNPTSFYEMDIIDDNTGKKGDKPIALSESFFNITGYTSDEVALYYENKNKFFQKIGNRADFSLGEKSALIKRYGMKGEIMTLFYRGVDLKDVNQSLDMLVKNAENGGGYNDIVFVLTAKDGTRLQIPWRNHVYCTSKNGYDQQKLSLRTGNLGKLKPKK